jgi:hypothetical protein
VLRLQGSKHCALEHMPLIHHIHVTTFAHTLLALSLVRAKAHRTHAKLMCV